MTWESMDLPRSWLHCLVVAPSSRHILYCASSLPAPLSSYPSGRSPNAPDQVLGWLCDLDRFNRLGATDVTAGMMPPVKVTASSEIPPELAGQVSGHVRGTTLFPNLSSGTWQRASCANQTARLWIFCDNAADIGQSGKYDKFVHP